VEIELVEVQAVERSTAYKLFGTIIDFQWYVAVCTLTILQACIFIRRVWRESLTRSPLSYIPTFPHSHIHNTLMANFFDIRARQAAAAAAATGSSKAPTKNGDSTRSQPWVEK
jgi:hypothetical protein